ncbi:hypothetical protein DYB36_004393 [Aphanomyces astaci]|uniref:NudC domain-containing protein 1 n=1 Tax=Aphanomyces astaci TaxID=112090 RepID=A0A397A732_APHAT|nr:hypothetical protein DYB36_004393 [Aphanomyces astaci]
MEINKEAVDDSFENYALSLEGKTAVDVNLCAPLLLPLEAPSTATKEVWNSRVYHNCLARNPFVDDSLYYISRDGDLVQVQIPGQGKGAAQQTTLLTFPQLVSTPADKRLDNPSVRFVAAHMGVITDGTGEFIIFGFMHGHWSVLWSATPLGPSTSLTLLQAHVTPKDESLHALVSSLDAATGTHTVYAFTVDLHAPHHHVHPTLVHEGGKAVKYAHFHGHQDIVFLVEGDHDLKVPVQSHPSHKRHHEIEGGGPVFKAPRAGLGFAGEVQNPDLPLPPLSHDDLTGTPLHDRFLASTTPYSSLDMPLHVAPPPSTALPPDTPLEIPTTDSMLGGYEECDDLDPNASAVLYAFHFGPSSRYTDRLLFQYDVHGLVFRVESTPLALSLVHESTFPAFGYVQASKTHKKYMGFHPSGSLAVLADFEKRVYLYKGRPDAHQPKPHVRTSYLHELASDEAIYGLQFLGPCSVAVLTNTRVVCLNV